MAFPTSRILDSFNRANESPLFNATWAAFRGETGELVSEKVKAALANNVYSGYWSVLEYSGNYQAFFEITTVGERWVEVWLRSSGTGSPSGYSLEWESGKYNLIKWTSGTESVLASLTATLVAGDALLLNRDSEGHLIGYRRHEGIWSELFKATDTTYIKCNVAFAFHNTATATWEIDNFGGGNPEIESSYIKQLPPSYHSPRRLFKPFPFAVEIPQKISLTLSSNLLSKLELTGKLLVNNKLPSTTIASALSVSAPLKTSLKISSTSNYKLEIFGKLIAQYKLPSTNISSNLSIVSSLTVNNKISSTISTKLSVTAPIKINYKLPSTKLESKLSISAPLLIKTPPKLESAVGSKLSISAPARVGLQLSSSIENKLSVSSILHVGLKLSSNIESKLLVSAKLGYRDVLKSTLLFATNLSGSLSVVHPQEIPVLTRLSEPKRIYPMPSVKWNWWLVKTSNMAQITELNGAHSKSLQLMLNKPGTASCWMHLEDEKTQYVEEHKTSILCYRNNKPIWSGEIYKCEENADNQNNSQLKITALGWPELFNKRDIHTGKEFEEMIAKSGASYTPVGVESAQQISYANTPMASIANDLIIRANIDVQMPITLGLTAPTNSINYTLQQFENVGSVINKLTAIESGFDFYIDPITRKFSTYRNEIRGGIAGLGQDRGPGVRFTFPGNCVSVSRSADGTKTQNRTEAVGQYGVGKGESIQSIEENGLFEATDSLPEVTNTNILIAYANIETYTLEKPFKIVTFNPRSVNDSESYSVPRPFEDYEIGDIVYATIKKGPRFQVGMQSPQPVRIYGMNISIDDNGIEKVTGIQTVYSQ